ncbi:hypothetical protein [Flavobacterium sp.]|uniref:hypothetical protein n=2 Tax=Flavobacterium sp. TaxID=239 RepID=UPI004047B946
MNTILFYSFIVTGIIPVVLYFRGSKVSQVTTSFLPFIILTAFSSFYEYFFSYILQVNTSYWFRIYSLLEFYVVWYFYYKILEFKKCYLIYGSLYLLLYGYLLIDWSPKNKIIEDLPLTIAITLMVVVSSFLWFVDVFKKMEDKALYHRTEFYYISSLLIYFTGTFLVFLMADYIINNDSIKLLDYWVLIIIFNLILRVTLIFTVWKARIKSEH